MPTQATKPSKEEPASKAYRFDARLNESQKLLLQRAADLEGRTLTDFVLHSAESAAERTIQERTLLVLSVKDTETFMKSVLSPAPNPGPVLRRAAKRYKERLGL